MRTDKGLDRDTAYEGVEEGRGEGSYRVYLSL